MSKPRRHTQYADFAHEEPGPTRRNRFHLILAILAFALFTWSVAQPFPSQAHNLYQAEPIDEPESPEIDDLPDDIFLEVPPGVLPGELDDDAGDDVAGLGELLSLPSPAAAWEDTTALNVAQMRQHFEDLLHIEANGDFQFFYTPDTDGGTIRILPVADSAPLAASSETDSTETDSPTPDGTTDVLYLDLAWALGDEWLLPLPAGERLDVEVGGRVYSPPTGATLSIREQVDGEWQSSSITMAEIQWSTYRLAREISSDAQEVRVALRWQPTLESAWLEFRLPRMIVGWPDEAAVALAPTDTPTPTPEATPTPESAAEAEAEEEAGAEEPEAEDDEAEDDEAEDDEAEDDEEEELVPLDTPTPVLLVVTSTPTPEDVFEEATRVALATAWVPILGTSTPTPENMVTPTDTPTPFIIVVTNTPVPQNAATAVYQELLATAVAFTTGTPTPYPEEAEVLLATNTPAPEPKPTNTPTPLFVLLDDLDPTATPEPQPTTVFPEELIGKIMFLSSYGSGSGANVLIMNPDGSELGIMSTRAFYNRAVARDAYSADRRFHTYVQREGSHAEGRWFQIKFDDAHYENAIANPMTFFDNGHSWSPVWSPTRQSVAFVSNDTRNDEIYLVNINEWPAIQLTDTDWEWNHHPSFSPDGAQIVFSSNRNTGTRQIWMMDASGGNQRQITNFPFAAWNPVWVKYPDS